MSKIPVFIPYVFIKEGGKDIFPYDIKGIKISDASHVLEMERQVLPPLSQFAVNATNTGFVNLFFDKDNILRDITAIVKWNNKYYPFIGVVIAAHYHNVPIDQIYLKKRILHIGPFRLKLRKWAKFRPAFGEPYAKYKHFSYSDLLEGNLEDRIKGRFVVMGYNATGLSDYFVTESSNRFPGSEILAVFIDYMLNETSSN